MPKGLTSVTIGAQGERGRRGGEPRRRLAVLPQRALLRGGLQLAAQPVPHALWLHLA